MKKLWCLFRRRFATGTEKLCVAFSETEGRVRACPYATEEEAKELLKIGLAYVPEQPEKKGRNRK